MTNKEAEEYAKNITYRNAVYNALQGRCIPYRKATLIKLHELLDMIEPLKQEIEQTRWIPCSERPPEKQITIGEYVFSENVLGTEGFTIRKAYYNYTTKEWFDGNKEMEWNEITHWMPLPEEPPKAESE